MLVVVLVVVDVVDVDVVDVDVVDVDDVVVLEGPVVVVVVVVVIGTGILVVVVDGMVVLPGGSGPGIVVVVVVGSTLVVVGGTVVVEVATVVVATVVVDLLPEGSIGPSVVQATTGPTSTTRPKTKTRRADSMSVPWGIGVLYATTLPSFTSRRQRTAVMIHPAGVRWSSMVAAVLLSCVRPADACCRTRRAAFTVATSPATAICTPSSAISYDFESARVFSSVEGAFG